MTERSRIGVGPCENCGDPYDDELIETVDGKGTGWKCETCRWWNWTTRRGSLQDRLRDAAIRWQPGVDFAPDLLRQAADEIERLQDLVEQAIKDGHTTGEWRERARA